MTFDGGWGQPGGPLQPVIEPLDILVVCFLKKLIVVASSRMGGGSAGFRLLPQNAVKKQEAQSLTESVLPRLARGLTAPRCLSAE